MKQSFIGVVLLITLCLTVLPGLYAQTGNGSIQGTVKDVSGAVIPGAKVVLVHLDTNRQYETTTNGVGFYVFPSVLIGNYKLTVSAPGMETWEGKLLLQVLQTATVDPVLKVGATATTVTVAGDITPLVTTSNATIANTLERARIEQLPLNGRFFQTLVMNTTPGLEGAVAAPRVNGMRASSMEYLQDGAVLENRDTGELQGRPPGIDSIQEFRVETSSSSAKMNRPASTVITTRSGTNELHGAAFETARNNAFGIARSRTDYYTKAPHLVRNEFGASLGGPVYLPKLYNGKNRTFFFFGYEAYRNMQASTTSIDMPTMAMRNGDFSNLITSSGRQYNIYNPWTTDPVTYQRQQFSYNGRLNVIDPALMSPLAKYLYSVTPKPTLDNVNPLVAANYYGLGPNNRRDYTNTARVDQRLSDRDQLFFRVSYGKRGSYYLSSDSGAPIPLDNASNNTTQQSIDASGVASWNHTFSPTFFSETLFNVGNEDWAIFSGNEDKSWPDFLGLPNPFHKRMWPQLTNTGFGMDYEYPDNKRNNITRIFNLDENLTKVYGRHEFQFGGRFRNERLYVLPDQQQPQGSHQWDSVGTGLYDPSQGLDDSSAVPYTGHTAASFFIGYISYYSNQFVREWYYLNAREYAAYFQDNFKVTPRLTLNYGVRWEFYPNISENNNILTGFDLVNHAVVNAASLDTMYRVGATLPSIVNAYANVGVKYETPSQAGLPDKLIKSNPKDFGPRFGFAYRFSESPKSFVLRGGYALYGYPIPLRTFNARMRSNPPTSARFVNDTTDAAQSPDGYPNYGLRAMFPYIAGLNSTNIIDLNSPSGITRGSFRTSFFDPNQPTSRAHEWNLSLEKEIMPNTVARVQYIGNHGARLDQFYEWNETPPDYIWYASTKQPRPSGTYSGTARRPYDKTTYGTVEEYSKIGWSNYNGIQLELRRQYSKGYGYQLFYVMSNALIAGGNGWSSDLLNQPGYYLPGSVPVDTNERDRLIFYRRDSSIPKHRIRGNWIVDLPFGKGKPLAGNAGPVLNRLIGGWQLAGYLSVLRGYGSISTGFWGPTDKIVIYGRKYPIQDCRSGTCYPGYLWWNGYIPANRINSYDPVTGKPNGVMGVPPEYKPAVNYIWNMPKNPSSSDPMYNYYDTNYVWIPLSTGTIQRVAYDRGAGLNPMNNQLVPGPWNSNVDASLYKMVPINERFTLRFNADFFNVLNMPGTNGPNSSTGIVSTQSSYNSPRQLQLTLRLQW